MKYINNIKIDEILNIDDFFAQIECPVCSSEPHFVCIDPRNRTLRVMHLDRIRKVLDMYGCKSSFQFNRDG